ncbi:MAG: hypothetical protein KDE68_08255 [Rhodocyclaceae bacterium]|nr:hypothetical protein [Rhodocyclaceae bacterium]
MPHPLRLLSVLLALSFGLSAPPLRADSPPPAVATARWPASGRLQHTMTEIARMLRAVGLDLRANVRTDAQYDALGDWLDKRIATLSVADAGPAMPAQKALTLILGEMHDSADLMRHASHQPARHLGYLMAVRTANNYGKEFDHPGWEALPD